MKDSEKVQKMNQALIELIDERIASYIHEHADGIRSLLGESKSSISVEEYQALQEQCQEWKSNYENSQNQLQQVNAKLSELEAQVEPYQQLEAAYHKYLSLPERLHVQLRGIFGQGSSALDFYKEVVQPKRIENFFDYLAQCINNTQDDEALSILKELLYFCINEASYKRIHVEIGMKFDSQQMQLAAGSSQLGTVECILLDGYRKHGDGMPVRKSIVCIGDR